MSDKNATVPVWMLIVCWVLALPTFIDGEYWWWLKVPLILPFLAATVGLARLSFTSRQP